MRNYFGFMMVRIHNLKTLEIMFLVSWEESGSSFITIYIFFNFIFNMELL